MKELIHNGPLLTDDEREAFEERAAIMEFDGGLPRHVAEQQALAAILRRRNER